MKLMLIHKEDFFIGENIGLCYTVRRKENVDG